MVVRAVLLTLSFVLLLAAVPTVEARPPLVGDCVVGSNASECLVSVYWVVCVTEPCDPMRICVGYGLVCV